MGAILRLEGRDVGVVFVVCAFESGMANQSWAFTPKDKSTDRRRNFRNMSLKSLVGAPGLEPGTR